MPAKDMLLRCELRGHLEDVRGVCVSSDGAIATASRDKTVRIWREDEQQGGAICLAKTLVGHSHFAITSAWIPPGLIRAFPNGALASGGMDTRVLIWDVDTATVVQELKGHTLAVTCLAVLANGVLVSGSLDSTLRMWKDGACTRVITGHAAPVLSLLALPDGRFISGSGDCTAKLWSPKGVEQHMYLGHSDSVRGLGLVDGVGFLTSSHDCTLRLWSFQGASLMEYPGHDRLVYSVAASPVTGLWASGSEDNSARVWQDGRCVQTLEHPGCVWSVAFLPNGDLVTGCSDGIARVWTHDPVRAAPPEVVAAYASRLEEVYAATRTFGGKKLAELPGPEALQHPGRREGETKIIRQGGTAVVFQWSAAEGHWDEVGEVVDNPGDSSDGGGASGGSKMIDGVKYDHVFSVDLGDGAPMRQLGYNLRDNPHTVAAEWLDNQGLDPSFREEVVRFIIANTAPLRGSPSTATQCVDPFTGAGAYCPPAYAPGVPSAPAGGDPFTSQGAYAPAGVGAPASAPAGQVVPSPQGHIPKISLIFFDAVSYDPILAKLKEFSCQLATQGSSSSSLAPPVLSDADLAALSSMAATLKNTSRYHASRLTDPELSLLANLLLHWPPALVFPVLDLLRMVVLHPHGAEQLASATVPGTRDSLLGAVLARVLQGGGNPIAANMLTGARVVVNAFRHGPLREWVLAHTGDLLSLLAPCGASSNKNVRIAWATVLINYAAAVDPPSLPAERLQCLSMAIQMASPAHPELV
eukprot:jgi/Mesvir1/27117/Mv20795-RA.2